MAIWMAILLMVQESYSTEKVVYPTIDKVLKKSQVVQESLPLGPFFFVSA